jgi:hypothetical protein
MKIIMREWLGNMVLPLPLKPVSFVKLGDFIGTAKFVGLDRLNF